MIKFTEPTIGEEELDAIKRVMSSKWIAQGREVEAFEDEFAYFVGCKYAIFTNSCTSALKMSYKFMRRMGYEGYSIPRNTYCATYAAAEEAGLNQWRGNRVKVNVHYGGIKDCSPCDIEDSAHRIEPNDPLVGKIRCYSFHPTKNMTSILGGMAVTNSKDIAEILRLWQHDGIVRGDFSNYRVAAFAGGYESSDVNAAVGRVQLKRLVGFNERRKEIVDRYNRGFGLGWTGNHLMIYPTITTFLQKSLWIYLRDLGVESKIHYPGTTTFLSLPLYPGLTNAEVDYVMGAVGKWWEDLCQS